MKIFLLLLLLSFSTSLCALEKFQWYQEKLPESQVSIKPCYNGKFVACKLMWRNKMVIYDPIKLTTVFEIDTRTDDYYFSASNEYLYLYFRDKNELVTYDINKQVQVQKSYLGSSISISYFATAEENDAYGLVLFNDLSYGAGLAFIDLKTGKLSKINPNIFHYNSQKTYEFKINPAFNYFETNDNENYRILDHKTATVVKSYNLDIKELSIYTTEDNLYLSHDPKKHHFQFIKFPMPLKNIKKVLTLPKINRIVVLNDSTLFFHTLEGMKSYIYEALPGQYLKIDLKLPKNFSVKYKYGPEGAEINNGIITWAVPDIIKNGEYKIGFYLKEPFKAKAVIKEITFKIYTGTDD